VGGVVSGRGMAALRAWTTGVSGTGVLREVVSAAGDAGMVAVGNGDCGVPSCAVGSWESVGVVVSGTSVIC
jgi:hypothetical protein